MVSSCSDLRLVFVRACCFLERNSSSFFFFFLDEQWEPMDPIFWVFFAPRIPKNEESGEVYFNDGRVCFFRFARIDQRAL